MVRLSVATNWRDRSGESRTDWHDVVAFGHLAETCTRHLRTGRQVLVEGRISYRKINTEDGHVYRTNIRADAVHFLGPATEGRPKVEDPWDDWEGVSPDLT